MRKKVTVAIPVYNGEKFILEALNSVVNQTVKVNKIIICDNQSTDYTIEKVNDFIAKNKDFDIQLFINEQNLGYIKNFIKCYERTITDFLVILHVDDLLKNDTVEKQLLFFEQHPNFGILGGKGDLVDSNAKLVLQQKKTENLLFNKGQIYEFIKATGSYLPFSTVMYNKVLTDDLSFFEEESLGPDELYWPKLLKIHPIAVLGQSLINNRVHEDQAHVRNMISKFDLNIEHLQKKLEKANLESSPERIVKTKSLIKKQMAQISIRFGKDVFKYYKNFKYTFKYFYFGFKQFPAIILSKYFIKTLAKMANLLKD